MPRIKVVTSFGPGGYKAYGEQFIKTFIKNWPKEVDLEVCYHDVEREGFWPKSTFPKVTYRSLNGEEDHEKFVAKFGGMGRADNFRYDVARFCHKVYALTTTDIKDYDWIIWLDCDIETITTLPPRVLLDWLQSSDFVFLQRDYSYPETSFMAFNLRAKPGQEVPKAYSLLVDLKGIYDTGEVINYKEWHDGFIMARLLLLHRVHGLQAHSLTEDETQLNSFDFSPLSRYMIHMKGPFKQIEPVQTGMRYDTLVQLIDTYKPKVIAETGTWRGDRAIQMAQAVLKHHDSCHYIGFDLFDSVGKDLDVEEFNTKKHFTKEVVSYRLKAFARMAKEHGKEFTFDLYEGNTNQTLKDKNLSEVEFAFLDGGHSPETAENDWLAFKDTPVVVFDDYLTQDKDGRAPPESAQGTNYVLKKYGLKFKIPPGQNAVLGGGLTALALVVNDPKLKMPEFTVPLKVKPQNSVDEKKIYDAITENTKKISRWVNDPYKPHGGFALICSGGPSLEEFLPDIKKRVAEGAKVFCVKHAYPRLLKAGVVPFGCVVLDPRPADGVSTHGIKRKDLFAEVHPYTNFFVATMTEPSMVDYLISKGVKIYGWHAYFHGGQAYKLPEGHDWITGGTCSAFRAISIAHYLGFRNMDLYGFDLCVHDEPDANEKDEQGRPKWLHAGAGSRGKKFWTTGELIAAAQDFDKLVGLLPAFGLDIDVHGEGIVQEIWHDVKEKKCRRYDQDFDLGNP